jgi:hypothetical protein
MDAGLPWTRQYVSTKANLTDRFPILDPALHTGPADAADLPEPALTVTADQTFAGVRTVTVLITPQRPVRLAYLKVTSDQRVLAPDHQWRLSLPGRVLGQFMPCGSTPPRRTAVGHSDSGRWQGHPARARRQRRPDRAARPRPGRPASGSSALHSELVVVVKTYTV